MILSQLLLIQIFTFARTVLVVDVEEFVCQEGNGFLSFKDVCPVTRDEGIAEAYAFDSASDGSCRIALSSMVGGNDDGFERIIYGNGAVDGNRQCFFCIRSVAKGCDGVDVVPYACLSCRAVVCLLAGCRHEGQDRIGLVHLRQDGFRIIQRFRE